MLPKVTGSRPVISAGPVELENPGFIEIKPRQGACVCDYRRKGTIETLIAIMRYNGGIMRHHEVSAVVFFHQDTLFAQRSKQW